MKTDFFLLFFFSKKTFTDLFRQVISELMEILCSDPCRSQPWRTQSSSSRQEVPIGSQRSLANFNLITHGFGVPTMHGMLSIFQRLLSESIRILDKDFMPTVNLGFERTQPQQNVVLSTSTNANQSIRYMDSSTFPHPNNQINCCTMNNFSEKE